jgi:hypothetical protein
MNNYQEFTIPIDSKWIGHRKDKNKQCQELMSLATSHRQHTAGHELDRNARIAFAFTDDNGTVTKNEQFLLLVEHDAVSLHFLMSESSNWMLTLSHLLCLLKAGRCYPHRLHVRYTDQPDYPHYNNLTNEPMYDRTKSSRLHRRY